MLDLCWINVGSMLNQCRINVGSMSDQCWIYVRSMSDQCWIYVGSMSDQCRINVKSMSYQCWINVVPILDQFWISVESILHQCWSTVYNAGPTLLQQCVYILFAGAALSIPDYDVTAVHAMLCSTDTFCGVGSTLSDQHLIHTAAHILPARSV